MNQMEIFKNPEFGSVRVIEENGKYLFCGLDVTAALGYKDSAKALKKHCTAMGGRFTHSSTTWAEPSKPGLFRKEIYTA